jgi:acyl-CoA thioester hydrolase
MSFDAPVTAPAEIVRPEWIDYNGHLNMAYYNVLFDHAVDHAFALIGCGPDYAAGRRLSFFTAEAHVTYRRELAAGDTVEATVHLLEHDGKRLRIFQELRHADGWLSATSESLVLHVDLQARKVVPFPADILERVEAMRAAHDRLAAPERAGIGIALKRRDAGAN